HRPPFEVLLFLHVLRAVVPRVGLSFRHVERAPLVVAVEDIGILLFEELALYAAQDLLLHLLRRRPDVSEEHGTVRSYADWFAREVEIHSAGEGVRDDERR